MSDFAIATTPDAPWLQRIAERPPWTPWRLAIAVGLGLFALFFAAEWLFDRFPLVLGTIEGGQSDDALVNLRLTIPLILLAAYLPAALADAARGARCTFSEILPFLGGSPEAIASLRAEAGRFAPASLRRAGVIGIVVSLLIPILVDRNLGAWAIWRYPAEPIAQRLLLPATGWLGGRLLYSLTAGSRRLSQAGALVRVDLLDQRSFAPITRQALRHSLLILGVLSILALYFFDYEKSGIVPVVAGGSLLVLGAAATVLLVPLRGARHAIQGAKRAELDWCEAELRRARVSADAATRSIADLVAWRALVHAVPEWPLDAPTLRRFGLYLALPLGSWLGGALVDRAVDTILR